MIKSLIILLSFSSIVLNAQKVAKPDIQYVTLTDTIVIGEIKKYIKDEEKIDALFAKGKGYINMWFSYNIKKKGNEQPSHERVDTVFTYSLMTSFMSAQGKENTLDDMYPSFYAIIEGRLICINAGGTENKYFGFSEKSKKKYEKILDRYIEPAGSKSRTWLVLNRETRIYYLQSTISGSKRKVVVEKIKR